MALDSYAIGIDLGTANTCVAVYRNGQVEMIPHEGRSSMPSYVAFTQTGRLIGAAAKNQVGINPENTVFDALRLIGLKYSDPEVQADMKHFPFQVVEKKGKPVISVEYRGDTKLLTPEEILSMILSRAKRDAEIYLGSTIKGAAITTPSCFNSSQCQAIRDAALVSELPVLLLINGPTAACTDYTLTHHPRTETNVLVADFGAGTFNAVLAIIDDGIMEVKATASDLHLGGEDYDNRMVNNFVNEFERKRKQDLTVNRRALRRLRTACEAAKCELSSRKQTQVEIDSLYDEFDFTSTITRTRFEELCQDLFRSLLDPIERVLRDGKMNKSSVHEVIVIGGSSRIPKIQKLFSDFFEGKELSKFLNPDETVARGAAVHAAILSGCHSTSLNLSHFLLLDVAPLTLGIESPGGVMTPIVKRNSTVPTKKAEVLSTHEDNQTSFLVSVFEGERARTKDNIPLGKFSIEVSPAPRGVPQIEITFDCDQHGNKSVTAVEKGTRKQKRLFLQHYERLSGEEIECMKAEAQKYDAVDKAEAERVSTRNALESYLYSVKSDVSASDLRDASILRVAMLADILLGWLDENQSAPASEYLLRLTGLREAAASIALESSNTDTAKVEAFELVQTPAQPTRAPTSQPLEEPSPSADTRTNVDSTPINVKSSVKDWQKTFKDPTWVLPSEAPLRPRKGNDNASHDTSSQARQSQKYLRPEPSGRSDPHPVKVIRDSDGRQVTLNRLPEEEAAAAERERDRPHRADPLVTSPPESSRASPAPSEPIERSEASTITDISPLDMPRSSEERMSELFSESNGEGRSAYTDAEFIQISTYLRNTGRPSWSNVPRLYTVLRLIGQLPMLDAMVDQGITDIWFPFTPTSLPDDFSPSARAGFLKSQSAVLSKALRFEGGSDRKHTHFAQGEPLPFEVIGRLGFGAHGYVDKVVSTVSHREYARKLFRRTRGVSKDEIKSFLIELQVLKRVSHIHCVELVRTFSSV
jgi:heat shock 70kDa protein 1/2/6/8